MRGNMTEQAVKIALLVFYALLIVFCVWLIFEIYKAIMDLFKALCDELVHEIYEEVDYEGKKEEKEDGCSGETAGGTEFSGSNERDAEKEEGGKWQTKKS